MPNHRDHCAGDQVFGISVLLEDIILRSGSSLAMLPSRGVNTTWRDVTRTPAFALSFSRSIKRGNVGFLVQKLQGEVQETMLLHAPPPAPSDTAEHLRSRINIEVLRGDDVVACVDGFVLTNGGEGGVNKHMLHIGCLWDSTRTYRPVAAQIRKIGMELQHTNNIYGQFGLLPDEGLSGRKGISFFMKDNARNYTITCAGVSFWSRTPVVFRVNVYTADSWVPRVSQPFPSNISPLFHMFPYSFVVGRMMYMMYVVDYVVCFDLDSHEFTRIPLPAELAGKINSCHDYRVAPRAAGGLVLVACKQSMLHKWVLNHNVTGEVWSLDSSIELMAVFGPKVTVETWNTVALRDEYPLVVDGLNSVQVRSSSPDATSVVLTLGFEEGWFEVNWSLESYKDIDIKHVGRHTGNIFHVSEPWPPAK